MSPSVAATACACPLQECAGGHEQARAGIAQLEGEFLRGVDRVGGGQDGAQPRHGVEHHRVLRQVGRPDGHDVTLADAAPGKTRGQVPRAVVELAEGDGVAGDAVDQSRPVAMVVDRAEDVVGQRHAGNHGVGMRAAKRHGSVTGGASISPAHSARNAGGVDPPPGARRALGAVVADASAVSVSEVRLRPGRRRQRRPAPGRARRCSGRCSSARRSPPAASRCSSRGACRPGRG